MERGVFIDVRARGTPIDIIHDSNSDGMIGDDLHSERSAYTDVVTRKAAAARAAAAARSALRYAAYAEARVRASSTDASTRDPVAAAVGAARAEAAEVRTTFRVLRGAIVFLSRNFGEIFGLGVVPSHVCAALPPLFASQEPASTVGR